MTTVIWKQALLEERMYYEGLQHYFDYAYNPQLLKEGQEKCASVLANAVVDDIVRQLARARVRVDKLQLQRWLIGKFKELDPRYMYRELKTTPQKLKGLPQRIKDDPMQMAGYGIALALGVSFKHVILPGLAAQLGMPGVALMIHTPFIPVIEAVVLAYHRYIHWNAAKNDRSASVKTAGAWGEGIRENDYVADCEAVIEKICGWEREFNRKQDTHSRGPIPAKLLNDNYDKILVYVVKEIKKSRRFVKSHPKFKHEFYAAYAWACLIMGTGARMEHTVKHLFLQCIDDEMDFGLEVWSHPKLRLKELRIFRIEVVAYRNGQPIERWAKDYARSYGRVASIKEAGITDLALKPILQSMLVHVPKASPLPKREAQKGILKTFKLHQKKLTVLFKTAAKKFGDKVKAAWAWIKRHKIWIGFIAALAIVLSLAASLLAEYFDSQILRILGAPWTVFINSILARGDVQMAKHLRGQIPADTKRLSQGNPALAAAYQQEIKRVAARWKVSPIPQDVLDPFIVVGDLSAMGAKAGTTKGSGVIIISPELLDENNHVPPSILNILVHEGIHLLQEFRKRSPLSGDTRVIKSIFLMFGQMEAAEKAYLRDPDEKEAFAEQLISMVNARGCSWPNVDPCLLPAAVSLLVTRGAMPSGTENLPDLQNKLIRLYRGEDILEPGLDHIWGIATLKSQKIKIIQVINGMMASIKNVLTTYYKLNQYSSLAKTAAKPFPSANDQYKSLKPSGKPKRWLQCTKPEQKTTKKGKTIWLSTCYYKQGDKYRAMRRMVGGAKNVRPSSIRIDGKKIPIRDGRPPQMGQGQGQGAPAQGPAGGNRPQLAPNTFALKESSKSLVNAVGQKSFTADQIDEAIDIDLELSTVTPGAYEHINPFIAKELRRMLG